MWLARSRSSACGACRRRHSRRAGWAARTSVCGAYTAGMRKGPQNPFYVVLGVVGFLFTITAASSCLTVLRGVRRETAGAAKTPLETLMDRHGTALMAGQLAVLAVATVGAVALDEYRTRNRKP